MFTKKIILANLLVIIIVIVGLAVASLVLAQMWEHLEMTHSQGTFQPVMAAVVIIRLWLKPFSTPWMRQKMVN